MAIQLPYFSCDNQVLSRAARIAAGDIAGNCLPYQAGLLTQEAVCIMAGLDYQSPWTRDTAFNTVNALCYMDPETAQNTLLSVCREEAGKTYIDGQYWDCIIWALGAWQLWKVTGNRTLLPFWADTVANTLCWLEETEFDGEAGLFRGPAVYGDGIAAYPDKYAMTSGHRTCITDWAEAHPELCVKKGFGIPMKVLSTNCVYFAAYRAAADLFRALSRPAEALEEKAAALKASINRMFWNGETGRYDYLFDDELRCGSAEALGLSFAILFGIADAGQTEKICRGTYVSPQGIPCVWPSFDRYRIGTHYGRHSGTVWPHAQGCWALAMKKTGRRAAFEKELFIMARRAVDDMQFAEIYHPESGAIYGGMQEQGRQGIIPWPSCQKQTWSATAFWAMLTYGLFGLEFAGDRLKIAPMLPTSVDHMELKNLMWGDACITLLADRNSDAPAEAEIPAGSRGRIVIRLSGRTDF